MKNFNLRYFTLFFIFILFLALPFIVFAQMPEDSDYFSPNNNSKNMLSPQDRLETVGGQTYPDQMHDNAIESVVVKVINAVLGLLGIILLVLVIYGGYLWMTAQGNDDQVTKAKSIIRNAVIGLIIILAAYAISNYVVGALLDGSGGRGADSTPVY